MSVSIVVRRASEKGFMAGLIDLDFLLVLFSLTRVFDLILLVVSNLSLVWPSRHLENRRAQLIYLGRMFQEDHRDNCFCGLQ